MEARHIADLWEFNDEYNDNPDDRSSQSSDDFDDSEVFPGTFISRLTVANNPSHSDEKRIRDIVEVFISDINDKSEGCTERIVRRIVYDTLNKGKWGLLEKAKFVERYIVNLKKIHRQLRKQVKLGASYFPEHKNADFLKKLERALEETFESYREAEKVDALFDCFEKAIQRGRNRDGSTDRGFLSQIAHSLALETGPGRERGAIATAAAKRYHLVPSLPEERTFRLRYESGEAPHSQCNEEVDLRRIWNHFTISRDETSANNFARELLYAILSPHTSSESNHTHDRFVSEAATKPVFQYQQNQQASLLQLVETHQRGTLADRRDRSLLNAQKVRLQQTRQNMLLDAASVQTSVPEEEVTSMAGDDMALQALLDTRNLHGSAIINQNALENDTGGSIIDHQDLKHRIASLEQENKRLKTSKALVPRCQILYFIKNEGPQGPVHPGLMRPPANFPSTVAYLDEPTWSVGPNGEIILRANFPIPDVPGFLRQRPEISFVVSHYYSPTSQLSEVQNAARAKRVLPQPKPTSEILRLHSPDMIEAVENFLALQPRFSEEFPSLNIRGSLHAPYLFWYYYRSPTALDVLSQPHRHTMQLLTAWIEEHYAEKFDRVDDQIKRGVISEDTMPFLVKPGDVLVWKEDHEINAVIAKGWPNQNSPGSGLQSRTSKEQDWTRDESTSEKRRTMWTVDSWSFRYDGSFYRKDHPVEIILSSDQAEDEVRIEELNIHPLKYAEPQFKAALENRGTLFWRCRHQYLVSYENLPGESQRAEQNNGERFMVDFETYRQLHSSSHAFKTSYPTINNDECRRMDSDAMESDEPPPAPDIYVFPNTIPGYNLRSKKWVDLKVDMIRDVTWNKKSFEHLVVDEETKELVQALVKHQIAAQKSTDIIDRKGNGLIILLHGGPGTGKTFTAESVAEMAEKPLFRITCGDIGTEPEQVENYLDSVLHLGKIWDCIVLIDEAEVFLEQRNLNNLERNALVSVFLRVLEYYEGILILTSNRVGTFDEAFKSRILLSLHYDNLGEGQRTKIWKNFFKRLKELDAAENKQKTSLSVSSVTEPGTRKRKFQGGIEGVDFEDVECYITELAKHELNGRQIRNVITTARQLAVSRNELMRYKHLEHVIKVSSKFDNYLKTVREGFSDDQVARDEGIR